MKKSNIKLVVRREAIRMLGQLDLANAVGAAQDAMADTGGQGAGNCVAAIVAFRLQAVS
jgi:hypothetical protein